MDNRPHCNYKRDVSESIGKVFGPNGFGEALVMEEAVYDPATDLYVAYFRNAQIGDYT